MNRDQIRLSVLIPGYNTSECLWRRCLASVLTACGEVDEVICIDDGSANRPSFLARMADEEPRMKVLFLDQNVGQAAARNRGLEIAKGEYVTFVDSDDEVLPDIYDRCFRALCKFDRDIVAFGIRTIYEAERVMREAVLSDMDIGRFGTDDMKHFVCCRLFDEPVNKIYRRSFLNRKSIRFPEGICPGEDAMFVLSCVMQGATWQSIGGIGYNYYRVDGTTLSRYHANYEKTLWYWKKRWDEYLNTVGKGYDGWWPTKEFSEAWLANQLWDNMWRRGSPVSLSVKWRYLKKQPELSRGCPILMLVSKWIKTYLRLHFYFTPIRRWHMKRYLPDTFDFKRGDAGQDGGCA